MNTILRLINFLTALLLIYVGTAGNTAIEKEISSYFSDKNSKDDFNHPLWLSILTLSLSIFTAIPLALAMNNADARKQDEPDEETLDTELIVSPPLSKQFYNGIKTIGRTLLIGGPPALLAVAGSLELFNAQLTDDPIQMILALTSGLAATWGYNRFLSTDIGAKESCFTLFRGLPQAKKCTAALIATSIIAGNLSENYLGTAVFLEAAEENNLAIKNTITCAVVLLSTGFVCNTEIRAVFLEQKTNETHYNPHHNPHPITKYLLILPAALSGLFTSVGCAKLTKLILPDTSLLVRGSIFALSAALILYPNAKGFYHTTLPATDQAFKKTAKALQACKYTLFSRSRSEGVKLISNVAETPESPYLTNYIMR